VQIPKMSTEYKSDLLIHDGHLVVIQERLVKVLGLDKAVFVQKLHYWLNTESGVIIERRRWVWNTYEQWHKQSPWWSAMTIRRMIKDLEGLGVVVSVELNGDKGDHTKWYTIDYGKLNELWNAYLEKNSEHL